MSVSASNSQKQKKEKKNNMRRGGTPSRAPVTEEERQEFIGYCMEEIEKLLPIDLTHPTSSSFPSMDDIVPLERRRRAAGCHRDPANEAFVLPHEPRRWKDASSSRDLQMVEEGPPPPNVSTKTFRSSLSAGRTSFSPPPSVAARSKRGQESPPPSPRKSEWSDCTAPSPCADHVSSDYPWHGFYGSLSLTRLQGLLQQRHSDLYRRVLEADPKCKGSWEMFAASALKIRCFRYLDACFNAHPCLSGYLTTAEDRFFSDRRDISTVVEADVMIGKWLWADCLQMDYLMQQCVVVHDLHRPTPAAIRSLAPAAVEEEEGTKTDEEKMVVALQRRRQKNEAEVEVGPTCSPYASPPPMLLPCHKVEEADFSPRSCWTSSNFSRGSSRGSSRGLSRGSSRGCWSTPSRSPSILASCRPPSPREEGGPRPLAASVSTSSFATFLSGPPAPPSLTPPSSAPASDTPLFALRMNTRQMSVALCHHIPLLRALDPRHLHLVIHAVLSCLRGKSVGKAAAPRRRQQAARQPPPPQVPAPAVARTRPSKPTLSPPRKVNDCFTDEVHWVFGGYGYACQTLVRKVEECYRMDNAQ